MKVKLPILFETATTLHLEKLEIDFDLSDYEVRETIFYSISCIAPYPEFGNDYTIIYSDGFDFISPLNVSEVERIIEQHRILYGN